MIYRVMEDNGNRFLYAYADQRAIQIGLVHPFSPQEFPLLRRRWRATQLPPGADEARRKDVHRPFAFNSPGALSKRSEDTRGLVTVQEKRESSDYRSD